MNKREQEAEARAAFRRWYGAQPQLPEVMKEVLAKERELRGDPNWVPRYLNGGAAFTEQVEKRMLHLKEKQE